MREHDQHDVEADFENAALVRQIDEQRDDRLLLRGRDLVLAVHAHAGEIHAEDGQHDHEARDRSEAHVEAEVTDENRERPAEERERPEHPHRVTLGEAESHEAMRRVIASALRRRASGELARQRHERRVEDRDAEHEHRHRQRRDHATRPPAARFLAEQRAAREEEADEHRAAVAHEDRRGVVVVDEESDQRAEEREQHQRRIRLSAEQEVHGQRQRGDRRDAGREPVHVVEHVHGVRHADEPEERDQHVERGRSGPRQHEAEVDDRGGAEQLSAEFLIGLEVEEVVDQAEEKHRRAAAEDDPHLAARADAHEHCRHDSEEDRHAAEHRRRRLMPAIALRLGHCADTASQRAHERRSDGRQQKPSGGVEKHVGQHHVVVIVIGLYIRFCV